MSLETFHVPQQIFATLADLGPYERLFLATLCSFWEGREDPGANTFQASNYDLRDASGISLRAIPAVRKRLVAKEFISVIPGRPGRPTAYTIEWGRISKGSSTP